MTFILSLIIAFMTFAPSFGANGISTLDQWKATTTPFIAVTTQTTGKDLYIPTSDATTSSMTARTFCLISDTCITTWPGGSSSGASTTLLADFNTWTGRNTFVNATSTHLAAATLFTMGDDVFDELVGDGLDIQAGDLVFDCSDVAGNGLACSGENLTVQLGTSISVGEMTSTDFGDWTCNGSACSLDNDTVNEAELDLTAVTLADFTNDAGFITAASDVQFSTTSAIYFANSTTTTGFSTTSANYWKTQNTFESLTAGDGLTRTADDLDCDTATASVLGCIGTADWASFNSRLSTTTVALLDKGIFFSTTSADVWGLTKNYTKVSTSSGETRSQLAYWTTTNGTPALLGSVATGTVSGSGGVTVTTGQSIIGSGLTVTCTAGSGSATGCIQSADWTSFNSRLSTTTFALLLLGDTSLGNATTSYLGVTGLINLTGSGTSTLGSVNFSAINFTATSTGSRGINLTGGCFAINGSCIGASIGAASTTLLSDSNTFSGEIRLSGTITFPSILNGILATNGSGTVRATSTPTAARFFATSTLGASIFPYSSSTALTSTSLFFTGATGTTIAITGNASTSALTVSGVRSAVHLGSASGVVSAATTQTCTNQFVRAMSAAYAATCATVAPADVNLTTSWDFGGATGFEIPNGASPTVDAIGEIALDTTSNQLLVATSTNATYPAVFNAEREKTMILATSTSFDFTSATSTFNFGAPTYAELIRAVSCYTDAGTTTIRIGDGTNWMSYMQCGSGTDTIVKSTGGTNNSFTALEKHQLEIRNLAGTPKQTTVVITSRVTRD